MRFVSHDERSELNSAKDPKARLRAALSLAEGHLSQAETLTQQGKFDQASEELGSYLGLVDDARSSIAAINNDKSSTRDLYRHLDLALRLHVPRLAVMRRSTPVGYAVHLKTSEQFVQDIRTQAQDSFFGHTVLREPPANETKPEGQKGATDGPKRPQ
jgi:hypothetical protein